MARIMGLFFWWSPGTVVGQSSFPLDAMQDHPAADLTNPAWPNLTEGFHLDLGHLDFYSMHSAGSFNDLVRTESEGLRLDLSAFRPQLKDENQLFSQLSIRTISVRKQWQTFSIAFQHELNLGIEVQYPRSLIDFLVEGNASKVGQSIDLAFDGRFMSYNSYAISLSQSMGGLRLGVRPRLLLGNQLLDVQSDRLTLFTDPAYYQSTLTTDLMVHSVSTIDFGEANLLEYDFLGLDAWSLTSQHVGFGLDVGASYEHGSFRVGLSIRDLGFIRWNEAAIHSTRGNLRYDGIRIEDILDIESIAVSGEIDSLKALFDLQENQATITHNLRHRGRLSLSHSDREGKWVLMGHVQRTDRLGGRWSAGMAYWHQVIEVLRVGGSLGWQTGGWDAGLFASLKLQRFSPYISFSNARLGFDPLGSNRIRLAVGLSGSF
ncbi:MAG: hypothetical protein KTR24_00260 [Saprospiraceae bacterium]|nr:hypothetical protein [Saprospiraceae bacterium]